MPTILGMYYVPFFLSPERTLKTMLFSKIIVRMDNNNM